IAAGIPEAKIVFFSPASVPGFGNNAGFEMLLLDKSGGDINSLYEVSQKFITQLTQRPEIAFAQTPFNINYPQYEQYNYARRAAESVVSVTDILSAMQGYIGGLYAADLTKYGKQFRVMVQAPPDSRKVIGRLSQLYVKTAKGTMAPLSQFVRFDK